MTNVRTSNWSTFRTLCEVLGGQNDQALPNSIRAGQLPSLFDMASNEDLLPALAVRCFEHQADLNLLDKKRRQQLNDAIRENTLRNMKISAQALNLTKQLNQAGITPLFLKGTAQLLKPGIKNIGFRKQIDIDLIVKPDQVQLACEVCLADGYVFYYEESNRFAPRLMDSNIETALTASAAHHHLPPMVKAGYETTVELHKHFLPKRFHRRVSLEPFFHSAIELQSHDVTFKIPAADYQIIHMLLGNFLHDGHLARRTFPIREACDFIDFVGGPDSELDTRRIEAYCGRTLSIFQTLVQDLTGFAPKEHIVERDDVSIRLKTMQMRYSSNILSSVLNSFARLLHLLVSTFHNPKKIPIFLKRNFPRA